MECFDFDVLTLTKSYQYCLIIIALQIDSKKYAIYITKDIFCWPNVPIMVLTFGSSEV